MPWLHRPRRYYNGLRCLLTSRSTDGQQEQVEKPRGKEELYTHESPDVGVAAWTDAGATLGSTPPNAET